MTQRRNAAYQRDKRVTKVDVDSSIDYLRLLWQQDGAPVSGLKRPRRVLLVVDHCRQGVGDGVPALNVGIEQETILYEISDGEFRSMNRGNHMKLRHIKVNFDAERHRGTSFGGCVGHKLAVGIQIICRKTNHCHVLPEL